MAQIKKSRSQEREEVSAQNVRPTCAVCSLKFVAAKKVKEKFMDYILGFCFCYTDPTQSNQISSSSLLSSVDFMTIL